MGRPSQCCGVMKQTPTKGQQELIGLLPSPYDLSSEVFCIRNSWFSPKDLSLPLRVNEKVLFTWIMQIPMPAYSYFRILAPAFLFLIRSYLPYRPATAGSFRDCPVMFMTAGWLPWKELSCPQSHNKYGFKAVDLAELGPLWTMGVPSFQFSRVARNLFVYC